MYASLQPAGTMITREDPVSLNVPLPILGGVVDIITTFVRLVQPRKASLPILVTLSGIVILVRPVQLRKAAPPILVTPLPITTFVRPVQPENA